MTSSNTAFAGILLRVSAEPSLRLALPAVLILCVVSVGLHGETTLTFQELGELFAGNAQLRTIATLLWAQAMAPAARAALMAPGLIYLRALPIPPLLLAAHGAVVLATLSVLPTLPLWRAGYLWEAAALWVTITGLLGCLLPGARNAVDWLVRLGGALGLVILIHRGSWQLCLGLGTALSLVRMHRAWQLAPELNRWRWNNRLVLGPSWLALACVQLLHVIRRESAALSRTLLVGALGVFLIHLITRANQGSITLVAQLVSITPAMAAVSIMLALVLKRSRQDMDWLARSLGVSRSLERGISVMLVALGGGILAIVSTYAANGPIAHWALTSAHAVAWALLAIAFSSRSEQDVRSASLTLGCAFFAMFAIGLIGLAALAAEVGIGLLLASKFLLRDVPDSQG